MFSDMSDYSERFAKDLAAELRAEKARKQVNDEDIAQATNTHRVSISRYLSGARPIPLTVFADICDYLGVPPSKVIDEAEKRARGNAQ
ncbi:helix-turn-helix domain-containing protein [Pseudoscardovia suis]